MQYTDELHNKLSCLSDTKTRLHTLSTLVEQADGCAMNDAFLLSLLADIDDILLPPTFGNSGCHAEAALLQLAPIVASQRSSLSATRHKVVQLACQYCSLMHRRHDQCDTLLYPTVSLVAAVSDLGRDLACIERATIALLTQLLPLIYCSPLSSASPAEQRVHVGALFFDTLHNCLRLQTAFIDGAHVLALVQTMHAHFSRADQYVLECSIDSMQLMVLHVCMPPASVAFMAVILCRLVCRPSLTQRVWCTMRHLISSSLGVLAIKTITQLMSTPDSQTDTPLLKGGVFVCAAALWDAPLVANSAAVEGSTGGHARAMACQSQRVSGLRCGPTAVLSAFSASVSSRHPAVVYEVMLELDRLMLSEQCVDILPHGWTIICDICDAVFFLLHPNTSAIATNDHNTNVRAVNVSTRFMPTADGCARLEQLLISVLTAATRLRSADSCWSGDDLRLDSSLQLSSRLLPAADAAALVHRLAERACLSLATQQADSTPTDIPDGLSSRDDASSHATPLSWHQALRTLTRLYFEQDPRYLVREAVCMSAARLWVGYSCLDAHGLCCHLVWPLATSLADWIQPSIKPTYTPASVTVNMTDLLAISRPVIELLRVVCVSEHEELVAESVARLHAIGSTALHRCCSSPLSVSPGHVTESQHAAASDALLPIVQSVGEASLAIFSHRLAHESSGHVTAEQLRFLTDQLRRLYCQQLQLPSSTGAQCRAVYVRWLLRLTADERSMIGLIPASILNDDGNDDEDDHLCCADQPPEGAEGLDKEHVDSECSNSERSRNVIYSQFLCVGEHGSEERATVSDQQQQQNRLLAHFSGATYRHLLATVVRDERDWPLLKVTLESLPGVVPALPRLTASGAGADKPTELGSGDVDGRATGGCDAVTSVVCDLSHRLDSTFCGALLRVPPADGLTAVCRRLRALLVRALCAFSSLDAHTGWPQQLRIVAALEAGLRTRSAGECAAALAVCSVSLTDAVVRSMRQLLASLSRVSAVPAVAAGVIQLLSTLVCRHQLYASFTGDQFRLVCVILLPYTNPARFSHYVVSLAHHALVMWFVACKPEYRRGLVRHITSGLSDNLRDVQHMLGGRRAGDSVAPSSGENGDNEDSLGRRRSSSLSEQSGLSSISRAGAASTRQLLLRRAHPSASLLPSSVCAAADPSAIDDNTLLFVRQLSETCVDLMARYVGATYTATHSITAATERRLRAGVQRSWIIGSRYVTIRVAGCGAPVVEAGLCGHCLLTCHRSFSTSSALPHQSSEQHRSNTEHSQSNSTRPRSLHTGSSTAEAGGCDEVLVRRRHTSALLAASNTTTSKQVVSDTLSGGDVDTSRADFSQSNTPAQSPQASGGAENWCVCWCQGWGEICVRRPSGNMTWLVRLRNQPISAPLDHLATPTTSNEPISALLVDSSVSNEPMGASPVSSSHSAASRLSDVPAGGANTHTASQSYSKRSPLVKSQSGSSQVCHGVDTQQQMLTGGATEQRPLVAEFSHQVSASLLPEHMFLQLFHSAVSVTSDDVLDTDGVCGGSGALVLPNDESTARSLDLFDRIPARECHKVGVLYVAPSDGQTGNHLDLAAILRHSAGSARYHQFLRGLGRVVNVCECDPAVTYLGGLSQYGENGRYTIVWDECLLQMVFHVATMMPTPAAPADQHCSAKKAVIGNDFVLIVYNESGRPVKTAPVSGQFCYVCVVVEPVPCSTFNRVYLVVKPILQGVFDAAAVTLVSDTHVASVGRQMALHASLASMVYRHGRQHTPQPYASNWLERLRFIKRHQQRRLAAPPGAGGMGGVGRSSGGPNKTAARPTDTGAMGGDICVSSLDFTRLIQ